MVWSIPRRLEAVVRLGMRRQSIEEGTLVRPRPPWATLTPRPHLSVWLPAGWSAAASLRRRSAPRAGTPAPSFNFGIHSIGELPVEVSDLADAAFCVVGLVCLCFWSVGGGRAMQASAWEAPVGSPPGWQPHWVQTQERADLFTDAVGDTTHGQAAANVYFRVDAPSRTADCGSITPPSRAGRGCHARAPTPSPSPRPSRS